MSLVTISEDFETGVIGALITTENTALTGVQTPLAATFENMTLGEGRTDTIYAAVPTGLRRDIWIASTAPHPEGGAMSAEMILDTGATGFIEGRSLCGFYAHADTSSGLTNAISVNVWGADGAGGRAPNTLYLMAWGSGAEVPIAPFSPTTWYEFNLSWSADNVVTASVVDVLTGADVGSASIDVHPDYVGKLRGCYATVSRLTGTAGGGIVHTPVNRLTWYGGDPTQSGPPDPGEEPPPPGTGLLGPVTRLYPRDDGRGLSSAARIHPPTKARRIVGGYQ